jgi:hypothetical protein
VLVKIELATSVLVMTELAKIAVGIEDKYPIVPSPCTVETKFAVVKDPPPTVPYDVEKDEND